MEVKEYAKKFILEWFQKNRPELDKRAEQASELYERIEVPLGLAESNNDREAVALLLSTFLDNYYSSPTNQVCFQIVQEPEFFYTTSELQAVGFFYSEEIESLILQVKEADWYKEEYTDDETLLENEEFKERIRNILRGYWNDLI